MFRIFLLAIAATSMALGPALADRITRTVPANKSSVVNVVGTFNTRNCEYGPLPKPKIIQQPKHGKVITKRTIFKLKKGKCKGQKIKSTSVIYTPNRGFRGKDTFKTSFSFNVYAAGSAVRNVDDHFSINVK